MKIGRRIFYDNKNGSIIQVIGEIDSEHGKPRTLEEQIEIYKSLKDRVRETFDYIDLEYGQYNADFLEGKLVGVDPFLKVPKFTYFSNGSEPIVEETPLSDQITSVKNENVLLSAKLNAADQRSDFLEELIAEMAMMIYQ